MITREEAKQKVTAYANSIYRNEGDELVIVDKETITKEYGWVFFTISKKYLETQNFSDMVVGLGPILFERQSETIITFGTALTAKKYLEQYEKQNSYLQ